MRLAVPRVVGPDALVGWDPRARVATLAGETMGTGWRVQMAVPGGADTAGQDLAALDRAIVALLGGLVAQMSHWQRGSLLDRFNRAPAGSRHVLPADFAKVIDAALHVARACDGAFDPTIGALVDLWGFGPAPAPATGEPDAASIAAALSHAGWHRLEWDAGARSLRQPGGLRLDLSGIAKGHAVDRIVALLASHGVHHALVEVGGEFVGRGLKPSGDPWWVELETPGAVAPPLRVALHRLAVATSGDYVRGRHTLDPRTGRPVAHALAVSVVADSAMLADAWATALSVLPPARMRSLAEREGLAVRALSRDGAGAVVEPLSVSEWLSPALAAMLD